MKFRVEESRQIPGGKCYLFEGNEDFDSLTMAHLLKGVLVQSQEPSFCGIETILHRDDVRFTIRNCNLNKAIETCLHILDDLEYTIVEQE